MKSLLVSLAAGCGTVLVWAVCCWATARERAARQADTQESGEARAAGFWIRVAARMADFVPIWVLIGLVLVAAAVLDAVARWGVWVWAASLGACALAFVAYFTIATAARARTWGKHLAGLTVERAGGGRIGWGRALLRAVVDGIFIYCWPYAVGLVDPLLAAATRSKRALHDMAAGSRVTRTREAPHPLLPWMAALGWAMPFLLFLGLLRPFVAAPYYTPSAGMAPTLQINDRIWVNKLVYRVGPVERGDVVVFTAPDEALLVPQAGASFVKRVVGLPGETIEVRRYDGVYVNGRRLDEPYVADGYEADYDNGPLRLGEGQYFVLGDYRTNSNDSHRWGPLSGSRIFGRVSFRFGPPERIGAVH